MVTSSIWKATITEERVTSPAIDIACALYHYRFELTSVPARWSARVQPVHHSGPVRFATPSP